MASCSSIVDAETLSHRDFSLPFVSSVCVLSCHKQLLVAALYMVKVIYYEFYDLKNGVPWECHTIVPYYKLKVESGLRGPAGPSAAWPSPPFPVSLWFLPK